VAGAASATMLLGPARVAMAQECPITDPSCLQDTVGGVQGSVGGVVDGAKDEGATVVDTVEDTVGGLTDTVGVPPPGGDPPGDPGGPGGHHGGGSHQGGGNSGGTVRPPGSVGSSVQAREGGALVQIGTAINGKADAGSTGPTVQRHATTFREAATGIALSLLVVLGAVLLFMTIQGRLDRRDPKLALAPVTADVVTFA
jgi:hypothetical protein